METLSATKFFSVQPARTFPLRKYLIYMEVGRLLHVIAILSALLTWACIFQAHQYWNNDSRFLACAYIYLTLHLGSLPALAELDAWSRYQNFKMVRDLVYRYGFRNRFVKAMKHSKCQREAAFMAARDLGYKAEIKIYYHACGYRWYHLLPDFIWSHPGYLLTRHFWSTTFFTRKYNVKYYPG